MQQIFKRILTIILLAILSISCSNSKEKKTDRVIVGLESEVQTVNPLFAMSAAESNISELMYLGLVRHEWDNDKNAVNSIPVLAELLEWSKDSSSVLVTLRKEAKWSDGKNITPDDIIFSFDLYSDPQVQSRFFGSFKNFFINPDLSVDLTKSFQIISPVQFKINFKPNSIPSDYDFGMPIMPKHTFEKFNRKDLASADKSLNTVVSGPFKIGSWEKNQNLKLVKNEKSFLASDQQLKELVFKFVTDYNSRINQLKKGEIDLTENIRPEDVVGLKAEKHLRITAMKGREYDYLGLNNITPLSIKQKKVIVHNLFGNANVRVAIAHAINRQAIVDEYLLGNGELMVGPVAPIFKSDIDSSVKPLDFNLEEAKKLLKNEGWIDSDGDGILDKNGKKFSFTISVPSGNPLRTFTSTILQNNLKAVGIETKIEFLEPAVLFPKMFRNELDAWLAGWGVPIPLNLKPYWHSNKKIAGANAAGYSNKEIDKILEKLGSRISLEERHNLLKQFQRIISDEQPAVFLFWIDNLVGVNTKIKNIVINPLGAVQKCWAWSVEK